MTNTKRWFELRIPAQPDTAQTDRVNRVSTRLTAGV